MIFFSPNEAMTEEAVIAMSANVFFFYLFSSVKETEKQRGDHQNLEDSSSGDHEFLYKIPWQSNH